MEGYPWTAAVYDLVTYWGEVRVLAPLRRRLVRTARGQVLEIGAGTGQNLRHYPADATVIISEPDPAMLAWIDRRTRGRTRGQTRGARRPLVRCLGEQLPFAAASFDAVVVTLTLCSVFDPAQALAEVRRVLRPGGTLVIIEHVLAADERMRQVQRRLKPFWLWCTGGCHLDRPTGDTIAAAGFTPVALERRELPLLPLIIGTFRAPAGG